MMSVNSKLACIALSLTFLVQSCTIYKKNPITIDEAINTNKKVQIIKNDGAKFSLSKIEKIDGKYYGTKWVNGQDITLLLNEDEIQKIKIKDRGASLFVTIASVITGFVVIIVIIYYIEVNNNESDMEVGF